MTLNSKSSFIVARLAALSFTATLWSAAPALAQLNGENLLGDMGVKSGTQPEPGVYISNIYYRYKADSIRDGQGQPLNLDPSGNASQTINAAMPLGYWVTAKKILGANVGMMAVLPIAKGAMEAPGLAFSEKASVGLSDLYVQPLQLGWHFRQADAVVGVGLFVPTGRYTAGASNNLGKGMWSYEASAGGTLYLDKRRSFSLATTAYYETHSRKNGEVRVENVTLNNTRVGDILTLEGGIGKSFLHGAATIGAAYYAQWKVTSDDLGLSGPVPVLGGIPERHQVWGVGPEVTIPIATRSRLISLLNVRYLFEQGARLKTQGNTLMITNTIPLGGIKIAH